MRSENLTIEEKVDRLHELIESLDRRVVDLEGRLAAAAKGRSAGVSTALPGTVTPAALPSRPAEALPKPAVGEPDSISEVVIRWASRASLFPRLATLCFLLVIALILRTITDNGVVNTLLGMAINVRTRRQRLANCTGGLSGPAIRPVAVRMVWQTARTVALPIIGMGGILTAEDALEFLLAGASAVAVGTANFVNPRATVDIIDGIGAFLAEQGVASVRELVGQVKA